MSVFFFHNYQNNYDYQCMICKSHVKHYNQLLLEQDIPKPLFFVY